MVSEHFDLMKCNMNSDTVRLEVNLMLLLFNFLWQENCLHDFEIRSIISLLSITYLSAVLSRVAFLYQCLHASIGRYQVCIMIQ